MTPLRWVNGYAPDAWVEVGAAVTVRTANQQWTATPAEFAAGRYAAEAVAALDHERYVEILAVLRHGPLPACERPLAILANCACGSGPSTPSEHGTIETLVEPVQYPGAPITALASVGRCRVCGRVWVITESGDDHYSWTRCMVPFQGPSVA